MSRKYRPTFLGKSEAELKENVRACPRENFRFTRPMRFKSLRIDCSVCLIYLKPFLIISGVITTHPWQIE